MSELQLIQYGAHLLFNEILYALLETFEISHFERFFAAGGVVLQVLIGLGFVLFCLLLSRLWFRFFEFPKMLLICQSETSGVGAFKSVYKARQLLAQSMWLIRTTISVCPLLGLMGTVVGMIDIFDTIAINGVNDPQVLASGVARAILPTMAGMVIAISAMFLFAYIKRWSARQRSVLVQLSLAKEFR
jgi:biopolymer transport protein ExbB